MNQKDSRASGYPGACVDAPRICKVISDSFNGLALLSRVCQASCCGLKFATASYAARRTRSTSVQRALCSSPVTGFHVLNIEVIAAYLSVDLLARADSPKRFPFCLRLKASGHAIR